jgi:hypothetical protein
MNSDQHPVTLHSANVLKNRRLTIAEGTGWIHRAASFAAR